MDTCVAAVVCKNRNLGVLFQCKFVLDNAWEKLELDLALVLAKSG